MLIPDAAPHLRVVNMFVGIELPGFLQENLSGLRIGRIGDTAVIYRTDSSALRLVEMADALCTPIMSDDVDAVSDALTITHMISLTFRIAPSLENGLVGTFR